MLKRDICHNCLGEGRTLLFGARNHELNPFPPYMMCRWCEGKGYLETDVLDGVIEEKLEQQ